jgi:ubiquinone/menaquinone biosynthesis C-methylase UbiE
MLVCKFDQARDKLITNFFTNHFSGKKILELGCGSGDRTKLFYDYSGVIGIDIKNKITSSRKHKFEFLMTDLQNCLSKLKALMLWYPLM